MANIKPELNRKSVRFLNTSEGEFCLVTITSAIIWALSAETFARLAFFVSDTLYPFTYPFFHTPLHIFLPFIAHRPPFFANLIFGAFFGYTLYRLEKNIFFRRINRVLRAIIGAITACVYVFVSGLLAYIDDTFGLGLLYPVLLYAEADELPMLIPYYFAATLGITSYCDAIRRNVFLLP